MAKKPRLNIKKAIKRPGALTRKAKAAGESVRQFAESHESSPGLTGQQSRFYADTLFPITQRNRGR